MSPWLQVVLGGCALLLTLLQLAGRAGWLVGGLATSRASDAATLGGMALELAALRAWHHKIGEDPCDALGKLMEIHVQNFERRLTRLEAKVFNGSR